MTELDRLQIALSALYFSQNINMVTAYHNKLFKGINDGITELENTLTQTMDKKEREKLISSIDIYNNYFSNNLRNFTLIMHLSNFEEISTLVCNKNKITIGSSSSISRFKEGWEKKLGKSVGEVSAWNTLKEAEKIRNAILHSFARISLDRNPANLKRIIKKENLKTDKDRLFVSERYLNKVLYAIIEIIN